MKIEITYDGRKYQNLEDAIIQATVEGIKKLIEDKLKPFRNEINSCGGVISIDIPNDLKNMQISLSNIPEDLLTRLQAALYN